MEVSEAKEERQRKATRDERTFWTKETFSVLLLRIPPDVVLNFSSGWKVIRTPVKHEEGGSASFVASRRVCEIERLTSIDSQADFESLFRADISHPSTTDETPVEVDGSRSREEREGRGVLDRGLRGKERRSGRRRQMVSSRDENLLGGKK